MLQVVFPVDWCKSISDVDHIDIDHIAPIPSQGKLPESTNDKVHCTVAFNKSTAVFYGLYSYKMLFYGAILLSIRVWTIENCHQFVFFFTIIYERN